MKAFARRYRWPLVAAAALTLAAANVGWQEGGFVLLIIAIAFAGNCLAVLVPGWMAGYSAAKHSLKAAERIAIQTAHRREIAR